MVTASDTAPCCLGCSCTSPMSWFDSRQYEEMSDHPYQPCQIFFVRHRRICRKCMHKHKQLRWFARCVPLAQTTHNCNALACMHTCFDFPDTSNSHNSSTTRHFASCPHPAPVGMRMHVNPKKMHVHTCICRYLFSCTAVHVRTHLTCKYAMRKHNTSTPKRERAVRLPPDGVAFRCCGSMTENCMLSGAHGRAHLPRNWRHVLSCGCVSFSSAHT
jgi:hypothetical protein